MTIYTSLAISILSKILYDLTKAGFSKLKETLPLKIAISRTTDKFKDIEGLTDTLETWLQNKVTQKSLEKFTKGECDIDIETLSKTLVKETDFYYADKSHEKAQEIIQCFFSILNEEYLKSDEGLVHHSQREEEIAKKDFEEHKKTHAGIEQVKADTGEIITLLAKNAQAEIWKGRYENQYTKRIDEARDLLNKGKAKTAKELYEKLLEDISQEKGLSPTICFRIYTNLGCCEWELGL